MWKTGLLLAGFAIAASAQTGGCNQPAASPSITVSLPGRPFAVVPSRDGCTLYVSLTNGEKAPGIAVLKRSAGRVELSRVVPVDSPPTGLVLTHDGKTLIAAAQDNVILLDAERMSLLGKIGGGGARIYVNVTADDKLLFVSEERSQSIAVIDIARAGGYKELGKLPVGIAPIALTFSPDGKWLYTTSQGALLEWNWPKACKPEGRATTEITRPEGAVIVVDVAKARTDPEHSVVARVPAACSPVRMAMSPSGDRIYVTARNSNAVLSFDTAKLVSDPEHARLGMAPVGTAPVPVAVVDGGKKVVVGNSNRFGGSADTGESLTVLDAAKIPEGAAAILGSVPAGAFPREMRVSADGRTLFLTNFGSSSLQVIDISRMAPQN